MNDKKNIKFAEDATKGECVLHLSIAGTKEYIKETLKTTLEEIDGYYGKPRQGVRSQYRGYTHVITPMWENREY